VDGKARTLLLRMADAMPADWEVDVEDLSNVYGRSGIASCNGCVGTSMALCCWPCNCYRPNDKIEPDLLWNLDLYARLDLADAWAFVAPIYWYAPTSNLKLLFDRLVCMSGGNPDEKRIRHKDVDLAKALERSPEWHELSKNHLEGRSAAFFCYGDGGADEIGEDGRPRKLKHPAWFDPEAEPFQDDRSAYAPLVWQCRYSGIEVPDPLWAYHRFGEGEPYSRNQAEDLGRHGVYEPFDAWVGRFVQHVHAKGKVPPNPFRAYGREPDYTLFEEVRLGWKDVRMRLGQPPAGSSAAVQQELGLNRDVTLRPGRSEADRYEPPDGSGESHKSGISKKSDV